MDDKPNYYAIIPADVRYNPNINANVKLLYGEISALSNKYGYCIATNDYFSMLYNVSKRTITDWIKALEDMTYITTKVGTKRYEDGTIKKIRRIYLNFIEDYQINHIEDSQHDHIEVSQQNHVEENFSYNNTSNNNNTRKVIIKKPTLEEIKEYCKERNNDVNPQKFYDYYEANNWIDNKGNKVKSWKQKVITWEQNTKQESKVPEWFDKKFEVEEVDEKEFDDLLNI